MRCSWFRHCQSAGVALALLLLISCAALLWQTNQRGFRGKWADELQAQLAERGFFAEFSSTRLSFSKGLVVKDLRIFSSDEKTALLASADLLRIDVDRNLVARGDWRVRSIEFENAFLKLPAEFEPHHLSSLDGLISLSRSGRLELASTTGKLGELALTLEGSLTNFRPEQFFAPEDGPSEESPFAELARNLHFEIAQWSTESSSPIQLAATIAGDLDIPTTLRSHFAFSAPDIARNDYQMSDFGVTGMLNAAFVRIEDLHFEDQAGLFKSSGRLDLREQTLGFEVKSKANLKALLEGGFDLEPLAKITFRESPQIEAKGTLAFSETGPPQLSLTGAFDVSDFHYLENDWKALASDFSWQRGDLFLRNFVLKDRQGEVKGKLLFQNEAIRYLATSTLPLERFRPFIKEGSSLEAIVDRAKFGPESIFAIQLQGSLRPSDLTDWSASGTVSVSDFSYNSVPIISAGSVFNLTALQAIYTLPEVEFDLSENPNRRAFGGPESAVVRADSIRYDASEQKTYVDHLHGVCWPAPVLRLFLPKVADYVETNYRASRPPSFSSSGIVDYIAARKGSSFDTRIRCDAPLYHDLFGEAVELRDTSALIQTRHRQLTVKNLSSYAFSGPVSGELAVLFPNSPKGRPDFRGSLLWTRLRLAEIGAKYGFDKIEKGLVTGRLDFTGTAGRIAALNGVGNIALEQGELFKAPVFGPLSPLIAGIQGHKRSSHETARDASAGFVIRNGVLLTDDFITATDSLTVQAEGSIDLARKTLDMTARADTEGLLKLVTLPLNIGPLSGLFQFRAQGPISDPQWERTPFTRKKKKEALPLFSPPPKARIVPE